MTNQSSGNLTADRRAEFARHYAESGDHAAAAAVSVHHEELSVAVRPELPRAECQVLLISSPLPDFSCFPLTFTYFPSHL